VNKRVLIVLSSFIMTSCPLRVLGINALEPVSYVSADINDFTFTKAFFNQYSTLLNYDLYLEYPFGLTTLQKQTFRNNAVFYQPTSGSPAIWLTNWTTLETDYAETTLDNTWKDYFNEVLFSRNFIGSTGKAIEYPRIGIRKENISGTGLDSDITLTIRSAIRYRIAPAEILLALSYTDPSDDTLIYSINFYNNDTLLNVIDFPQLTATTTIDTYKGVFPIAITNVNELKLSFSLIDPTGNSSPLVALSEFNLFAQTEIAVPDQADSTIFGLEYIQVEWWDILGHLNNALWWLVNESFLSPMFEWLDTYIISFFTLMFNWIGDLIGI
jgi:hypothetical protein